MLFSIPCAGGFPEATHARRSPGERKPARGGTVAVARRDDCCFLATLSRRVASRAGPWIESPLLSFGLDRPGSLIAVLYRRFCAGPRLCTRLPQRGALVHGHLDCLALRQIDHVLPLHVDLSVRRIIRHFFTDPTWEIDLLICVLQLSLCKHYTI